MAGSEKLCYLCIITLWYKIPTNLFPILQKRRHIDPYEMLWPVSHKFLPQSNHLRCKNVIKGKPVYQIFWFTCHHKVTYTKWVEFSMMVLISWDFRLNSFWPMTILIFIGRLRFKTRSTIMLVILWSTFDPSNRIFLIVGKYFALKKIKWSTKLILDFQIVFLSTFNYLDGAGIDLPPWTSKK
jgi:hypothetical protein